MQVYNIEVKNSLPILTDLIETIRNFNDSENVYLTREYDNGILKPGILKNAFGINDAALPEFLNRLGIRSLTLDSFYDDNATYNHTFNIPEGNNDKIRWHDIKSDQLITDLKELFQHCRTIAFDDWTNVANSSDLWDGLLSDVIRPIKKTDLDFIFYLGDPGERLSFQVDEILDIISEFSKHGQVTFCLDENEAVKLWMVLNGESLNTMSDNYTKSELKKKYFSIFRTMSVDRLLIYSVNEAILYSNDQQFIMERKMVDGSVEVAKDARDNFVAGFAIGLLLQLDMQYCIALGLIVFGALGESKTSPDQNVLISYIERWISDLDKPDAIYLYQ
jgi:hypothetical protein